ncbi:MAG: NAD(P)H-binding protein [Bacteroidota bacterium]
MKKTAILLGATGLTGGTLLQYLLEDHAYEKVKLFSRRPTEGIYLEPGESHPKIEQHIIDLFELEKHTVDFTGDVVFCCIGTTKANTPDEVIYRKVDYGIPVAAARLAKQNQIEKFMVISAMGADIESRVFYNRTKGEMERDVLAAGVRETYILQPSLIGGRREESRLGESVAKFLFGVFGFLIPRKYKMIAPETIASAMMRLAADGLEKSRIPSDRIKELASG